jgi:hypothetical protein
MKPMTEQEIRAAFVNCSKGEAKRLNVPRDLAEQPWEDLDFLGWRDPQAPDRAYLVTELDGAPTAVVLRSPGAAGWQRRPNFCSLCMTVHTGNVSLMVAPRAGQAGKEGCTVGTYLCADLACSLYVRGKRTVSTPGQPHESLTVEEKTGRLTAHLAEFLAKVMA